MANSDPSGSQWSDVSRGSRKNPNTGWVSITTPTAHIDRQADTVTISFDIDAFNRGERRVAADEGMPAAAELKDGSWLTNIFFRATADYGQYYAAYTATQNGPHDDAVPGPGCEYVVQENRGK